MPQDMNVSGTLQLPAKGDWPSVRAISESQEEHDLLGTQGEQDMAPMPLGDGSHVYVDPDMLNSTNLRLQNS